MGKVGGNRNFGWGKKMEWAGKQALKDTFGGGRFGTVAGHAARWRRFCNWAAEVNIRDVANVRRADLAQYAAYVSRRVEAGMSVAYGKNLITSANVTLEALRGDKMIWVKPGGYIDQRSLVRQQAPGSLVRSSFHRVIEKLEMQGKDREAALARLCRELGLRRREASLLRLRLAFFQAKYLGRVNITEGTKGGRGKSIDRWVPAGPAVLGALERAINAAGDFDNLIPPSKTLAQWATSVSKAWQFAAKPMNLGPLKDLRSAYACERYEQLTGHAAPVVNGLRTAEKLSDRDARSIISLELGHNRVDVVSAYIGSGR